LASDLILGQFKLKEAPSGWQSEGAASSLGSERVVHEYFLQAEPEVKFHYLHSNKVLSGVVAQELLALLSGAPHDLTDEEFSNIEVVVGEAAEPEFFALHSKSTVIVAGRKALVIEGLWKFSALIDRAIFVCSEDGRQVDELHLTAPAALFKQYKSELEGILTLLA
jgi:hypothetical protein